MSFRISGLPLEPFAHLIGAGEATLAAARALRTVAEADHGYPCRVTLEDAAAGESLLLLNYVHQPADTPFRASHAIYVRECARRPASFDDAVPPSFRNRMMSLRAFDVAGSLVAAELGPGAQTATLVERLFADPGCAYVHAHYATYGCFAARIDRVRG